MDSNCGSLEPQNLIVIDVNVCISQPLSFFRSRHEAILFKPNVCCQKDYFKVMYMLFYSIDEVKRGQENMDQICVI